MAASGEEENTISAENVSGWTRDLDLSSLILVERVRLVNLRSPADIEEAESKLQSLESLLREAIIANETELNKQVKLDDKEVDADN